MVVQLAKTYQRSRIPLYLQVAATLRRRIEEAHWSRGQKISTLEQLQAEFQVARVTVRQALDVLQKEGLVRRQQGKGTFVSQEITDKRWLRLKTNWASLVATIEDNVPRMIPAEMPTPRPRLAAGEGEPAADYEYIRSIQSRDDEPYALVGVHLARHVYDLAPQAFQVQAALSVLSRLEGITIARAHQTLVIGGADTVAASHLNIALSSPTAEAHCVVVDDQGTAIYIGEIVYRGDCIKLDIDLLANGRPHT